MRFLLGQFYRPSIRFDLCITVFVFFCFFPPDPVNTVPPLTVQILPIADNGRYIDDDLPPFTQSSAKISTSSDGDDHLAMQSSKIREKSQLQPLTAGRKYELPCRAYGSRPPAKLTWWMDGRRLDTTRETVRSKLFLFILFILL